jgi:Luciferase
MFHIGNSLADVRGQVLSWPGVSVHAHRFGGTEFRFGRAEIGHLHEGGTVDIPFTRAIRDELLANGLAHEHRWVPDSGWTTFQIRSEDGARHAVWLMRLSYLRYALKKAEDAGGMLDDASREMQLAPRLRTLLEPFASAVTSQAARTAAAAPALTSAWEEGYTRMHESQRMDGHELRVARDGRRKG